jgi:hypothetical protein
MGTTANPLEINGSSAVTTVHLTSEGQGKLLDLLPATSAEVPHGQGQAIYLMLENVRGTHDASVLNVYLGSSEHPDTADYFLVGSEALYGLRRASRGPGLTFLFDITRLLLLAALAKKTVSDSAIYLRIVPDRPLPDSPNISVEHVNIFSIPTG